MALSEQHARSSAHFKPLYFNVTLEARRERGRRKKKPNVTNLHAPLWLTSAPPKRAMGREAR